MEKTPEFRDKWSLIWFAAWFVLFCPLGMGSVPAPHGAYWREALVLPLGLAFTFSVLAGLCLGFPSPGCGPWVTGYRS